MQKLLIATTIISLSLIAGCATSTDGIVEIGTDTYRVANLGRFSDYSSSALKARLYQDAYRYCAAKNKIMVPANGTGQTSASSTTSDVQFQCVARNQANLPGTPAPTL